MQLRSAVLCGFPDAAHDAGTSPQLQLHSAGIQLQPVLQRQIGFSKITYFGEEFFFSPSQKAIFIKEAEAWLAAWSWQVLNACRLVLSTLNIVLLQHFLRAHTAPHGAQFCEIKVLAEQTPSLLFPWGNCQKRFVDNQFSHDWFCKQ